MTGLMEAEFDSMKRTWNCGGLPDCWAELVNKAINEIELLRAENKLLRRQAMKDRDRAELADSYEKWLLEIGRAVGCQHLDENLQNCVIRAIQGDEP